MKEDPGEKGARLVPHKCRICGETIEVDPWARRISPPHYQNAHPEYDRWLRGWIRAFILVMAVAAAVLFFSLFYLLPCGDPCQRDPFSWLGFYATVGYVALSGAFLFSHYRKTQWFGREWQEHHGEPIR